MMGWDFYGRHPTAGAGRHFHESHSTVADLSELIEALCNDTLMGPDHDADAARRLAEALRARLDDGSIERHLLTLPPEPCSLCGGSGEWRACNPKHGSLVCWECDGAGDIPRLHIADVREFADFLAASGGYGTDY